MAIKICLSLTIALLSILWFASGNTFRSLGPAVEQSALETINVREAVKDRNSLNGKEVRIRGKVTGYHELMLYEGDEDRPGYLLQLTLSPETTKSLILMSQEAYPATNNAKGEIVVIGRFIKDGGKLYTYPSRVIERSDECTGLSALAVDRLDGSSILEYEP